MVLLLIQVSSLVVLLMYKYVMEVMRIMVLLVMILLMILLMTLRLMPLIIILCDDNLMT